VTVGEEAGEGEDDARAGGGVHAYIVTDGRRKVKCRGQEIYSVGWG
jgi:hypothetical protein